MIVLRELQRKVAICDVRCRGHRSNGDDILRSQLHRLRIHSATRGTMSMHYRVIANGYESKRTMLASPFPVNSWIAPSAHQSLPASMMACAKSRRVREAHFMTARHLDEPEQSELCRSASDDRRSHGGETYLPCN